MRANAARCTQKTKKKKRVPSKDKGEAAASVWPPQAVSGAEWFLSPRRVFVPCLLCHWDCCLFKRLACQTESATGGQTPG